MPFVHRLRRVITDAVREVGDGVNGNLRQNNYPTHATTATAQTQPSGYQRETAVQSFGISLEAWRITGLPFSGRSPSAVGVFDPCFAKLLLTPFASWSESRSVLTWNVAGEGALDLSANAPQVEAIGRIMRHLQPDIVTFQELPHPNVAEMTTS